MMPPKMVPRALVSLGIRMTRIAGCGAPVVADAAVAGARVSPASVDGALGSVGSAGSVTRFFLSLVRHRRGSLNRDAAGEPFVVAVHVREGLLRVAPTVIA